LPTAVLRGDVQATQARSPSDSALKPGKKALDDLKSCDWHPWLSAVVAGSREGGLRLWDVRASAVVHSCAPHADAVTQVKWNRTNGWGVLSGSRDSLVLLHDIRHMSGPVASFANHHLGVTAVAWHPLLEHPFVSGGADGHVFFCSATHSASDSATRAP
jgi:WD40 repeat protein